jgi:hypothetical protein
MCNSVNLNTILAIYKSELFDFNTQNHTCWECLSFELKAMTSTKYDWTKKLYTGPTMRCQLVLALQTSQTNLQLKIKTKSYSSVCGS